MIIELVEGFWIDPWEVKVVKAINDDSCRLYVTGGGNGFELEFSAEEIAQHLNDEREKCDEDDESDDD